MAIRLLTFGKSIGSYLGIDRLLRSPYQVQPAASLATLVSKSLQKTTLKTIGNCVLPHVAKMRFFSFAVPGAKKSLLKLQNVHVKMHSRSVTKFSLKTGRKNSVKTALQRFFRLDTGLWIRRRAGCHKRLHKKPGSEQYGLKQHVFCTRTQCIMLDKMVTKHWKRKKYYIDDPYEPYQVRHNFDWVLPFRRR